MKWQVLFPSWLEWEVKKAALWWVPHIILPKESEACEVVREAWFTFDMSHGPQGACSFWVNDLKLDGVGPSKPEEAFLSHQGSEDWVNLSMKCYLTRGGTAGYSPECRGQSLMLPSQTPGRSSAGCAREIQVYTFPLCSWRAKPLLWEPNSSTLFSEIIAAASHREKGNLMFCQSSKIVKTLSLMSLLQ